MELIVQKVFKPSLPAGPRSRRLMRMFGLDRRRLEAQTQTHACRLRLAPGQICLITGPSGSGKSVLLDTLYDACPPQDRLRMEQIPLDKRRPLIDCMEGEFLHALQALTRVGLGDIFTLLTPPARLSAGQQYRYRLARVLASDKPVIFADEFGSVLDRVAARVAAWQLRRAVAESRKCFILASPREDLARDLRPDVWVVKTMRQETLICTPNPTAAGKRGSTKQAA
jgi:ABC-type ATPase with predicted acetyltransferase domain